MNLIKLIKYGKYRNYDEIFKNTYFEKQRVVGSDYSTSKVTEDMKFLNKMWKFQGVRKGIYQGDQ